MKKFAGTWHIQEMETWDEDYFNMEVQAYIKINSQGSGEFQFGLVSGQIDVESEDGDGQRIDFTWAGSAEMDEASGSGWIKWVDKDQIKGKIKIHHGDSSKFLATRAKQQSKGRKR